MADQLIGIATGQCRAVLRLAVPLASHLVPTAVIGYGLVLPAAALPATGPVGIGFAASLAGTIITYVVGVRMARQCSVQRRPGMLGRILSAQAAQPRGLLGRALGRLWITETAAVNDRAIALLDPVGGKRVVEIGFGPGRAIRQLAARGAHVIGVEPSPVMLTHARRSNAEAIQTGQVHLLAGRADALPIPDAAVDAVLAVHNVYFWGDLAASLREITRVLVPGGLIVLAFRAAEHGLPRRFDLAVYRVPTTQQMQDALAAAGFQTTATEHDSHGIAYLAARSHR